MMAREQLMAYSDGITTSEQRMTDGELINFSVLLTRRVVLMMVESDS